MNIKQRAMGEKPVEHSQRYKVHNNNYDSTPSLLKGRQVNLHNKENNFNSHNYLNQEEIKFGYIQSAKSTELPKRLKTSMNEQQCGQFKKQKGKHYAEELGCSQDFVKFRPKLATEPQDEAFFKGQHVTFGSVNQRNGLMTSRDFIEEKKMKNEVIDEIMANTKRGLCKSFNQFNFAQGNCTNHPNKKAKYRLIAELSQGEQEMFYCSKCAINLLQQNFKIEEIKGEDSETENNSMRIHQISKFQLRLKSLEERAQFESERNYSRDELELISEEIHRGNKKFTELIDSLEKMRSEYVQNLNQIYMKKQNEEKARKSELTDIITSIKDIQEEIKEYKGMNKFAGMKQNQFQFINSTLNNKIMKFDQNLQKMKPPSPFSKLNLPTLSEETIFEKMREEVLERKQTGRRERQITFSRRSQPLSRVSEDDFMCDQLKRPFRVLFPSDEMDQSHSVQGASEKSKMLNSVRQKPNFGRI